MAGNHRAGNKDAPVYRAADIGFGFTKFSASNYDQNGQLDVMAIPSFAGPETSVATWAGMGTSNIINVKVGREAFAVGPDARRTAEAMGRQILESSFFRSNQYIALGKGALAMMNVPERGVIDHLVIGLPLNLYDDQGLQAHVEKVFQGEHSVPIVNGQANAGQRKISVARVSIIPQVMGSLISLSQESEDAIDVMTSQNLTIDVGYGTLLWLTSEGLDVMRGRSKGNMGGASSLLQTVLKAIDPSVTGNLKLMERLDTALRENKPTILVNGKAVNVQDYRERLRNAANDNLTELFRSVGTFADIDNIFLTGGGAHLYYDILREGHLKGRKIIYRESDARFQNVRGFQSLAESEN